jgi:predicted phage terminase large subunit-like protein
MNFAELPLLDFIPALTPEYNAPYHLREWCEQFERAARGEPVRALCAAPIRHGKTQATLHGIVWLLCKDPSARYMLLSHSFERSQALGKRLRQLADAAGVGAARGTNTIADWSTAQGGGVIIMSADQSRLGYDVHGLFFDDPIDENGALDPKKREEVDETITHYTARCQRGGKPGPVMGVMSRWHPDDPIGRRLARSAVKWSYIHYPAILYEGTPEERAFAEDVWALADLKRMREELKESDPAERIWWAQLMGDPQPEGSDLFGQPTLYTEFPTWGYRIGHGLDFAYVNAPGTDFFAAVSGRVYGRKLYIVDVRRHRLDATLLESTCKEVLATHGRAPMWSYQSGPEVGLSRLLIQRGIPIGIMHARYNKLVRAQKAIRRWNDGDVLIPESAPWRKGFTHRLSLFRGHDKDRDDEADALVSLCDGILGGASAGPMAIPGRKPYPGLFG